MRQPSDQPPPDPPPCSSPPSSPPSSLQPPASSLSSAIDHTLLKPDATPDQIDQLCREAIEHRFAAVCVNPCYVTRARRQLQGQAPALATVIGFPLGANTPETKANEAAQALANGADELDVVINLGHAAAGRYDDVRLDLEPLCHARNRENDQALIKVILETAAFPDPAIVAICDALADLPIDFLKTSTGFHPAGGATLHAVQLLHAHRRNRRIKAAGGIKDLQTALAYLNAGATRLGTSAALQILQQLH